MILLEAPGIVVRAPGRRVEVCFDAPHDVTSWAIVGGGATRARSVVIIEVRNADLPMEVDPVALLRARLADAGHPEAVGLMTSRDLAHVHVARRTHEGVGCVAVATVGLGNALRIGDPPGGAGPVGTIHVVCRLDAPLTPEAHLEAMSLAAEARTVAVLEADVPSRRTGARASGTGTDTIAIASPVGGLGTAYAGKHTTLGHLVGATVLEAMREGVARWKETVGA